MATETKLQLLPEYRDTTIEMIEKRRQHWYKVSGIENLLPSVTTFLKIIDKSGPLMGWARKDALEKVGEELQAHLQTSVPWRDEDQEPWIEEVLAGAHKSIYKNQNNAADAGTSAHELISAILNGGSPLVPESLRPAVNGARAFIEDFHLTLEVAEYPVWHPRRLYAGTIDMVARDADGRLVVVDWKRAKGLYDENAYQSAAYADALEALTGERVAAAYVVQLPQEAEDNLLYRHKEVHPDYREEIQYTYLMALELWWAVKTPVWRE